MWSAAVSICSIFVFVGFCVCHSAATGEPFLRTIPDQFMQRDTVMEIPFRIDNVVISNVSLTQFSAEVSNTDLVPPAGIRFLKTATNFNLIILPASCQFGLTIVNVIFRDGDRVIETGFILTVVEDQERLPALAIKATIEGLQNTPIIIPGTLTSSLCYPTNLILTVTAINSTLFPRTNISVSGLSGDWRIVLNPVADQWGESDVVFGITDPRGLESSSSTHVIVRPRSVISAKLQPDHAIRFEVNGNPGATNYVQTSIDLVRWQKGAAIHLNTAGKAVWTNLVDSSRVFFELSN